MAQVMSSAELIAKLPIVDENILGEALHQPQLFVEVARYRIARMRLRAQAEAQLDYLSAAASLTLRKRTGTGEKKMTETALKERIVIHPKIRAQRAQVERMYEAEEFAKLLLDAFKQRRDAIRVTAEAQIYEGMRETKELDRLEERGALRKRARQLTDLRKEHQFD